ncbi:helix-turn-helix transcriptional regulator [Ruegeria hyattellae]|uniref:helix-turn-helix transcriptional regulator n=1 Tax=Ruegeria hyattellae TaxID=3233337 RepID=UPI00355C475A
MLILSDPMRQRRKSALALGEEFGLTPAEAAVALELMQADGRAAAATRLGATLATVRTHMMRIFEKVGVKNQAALIRRMVTAGIGVEIPD